MLITLAGIALFAPGEGKIGATNLEDIFHLFFSLDVEDELCLVESHSMLAGEVVGGGPRGRMADARRVASRGSLGSLFCIWAAIQQRAKKERKREDTFDGLTSSLEKGLAEDA